MRKQLITVFIYKVIEQ